MDEVERLFMSRYGRLPPAIGSTPSMAPQAESAPIDPAKIGSDGTVDAAKKIYEKIKKPAGTEADSTGEEE